jgi:hypothetical protein
MSRKFSAKALSKLINNFSKDHPIASTALAFGSIGAGTAAMTGLLRDLQTAMDERKKKEEMEEERISPGTIVLHIPKNRKTAEACPEGTRPSGHDTVARRETAHEKEIPVMSHTTAGYQKDLHGKFTDSGEKMASTGFLNRTGQILTGVAAASLGYYGMQRLYEKLEQNRLKKQIAAAQKEYLELIDGSGVKNAEAVNSLFLIGDRMFYGDASMEKDAGVFRSMWNAIGNQSKNMTATLLASYILAGLGAGYITKRVLEQKFDQSDEDEEPQKVNRILFKAGESEDPVEIDPGAALATIGIMADCIRDSVDPMSKQAADYSFLDKVTATPEGRQWLLDVYAKSQGLNRDVSLKRLPNLGRFGKIRYARTLSGIRRNPYRHMPMIQGRVMRLIKKHPNEWFSALGKNENKDLVSHVAGNVLANGLSNGEFGWFARLPVVSQALGAIGKSYMNTDAGRGKALRGLANQLGLQYQTKAAYSLESLPAMLSRSSILTDKRNVDLDHKLDRILESMPVKKKKKQHSTEVVADGGEAEEYVLQHGDEIAKILAALNEKGLVE